MNDITSLSTVLVDTIVRGTLERIRKDWENLKKEIIEKTSEKDFYNLFKKPELLDTLVPEFKERFLQLQEIRDKANKYNYEITNELNTLIVRCKIYYFGDRADTQTAFISCLPSYFQSESFLKSIKTEYSDEPLLDEIAIFNITQHSYVKDSEFVKQNILKPEYQKMMMFFVGTQLINDIF